MALAVGLAFALALSIGNARAWVWLLAGAASYIVSTIYWRIGGSDAAFVAGMCDAAVALAIYFKWRFRWEAVTGALFIAMIAVNMLHYYTNLGVAPPWASLSDNAYAVTLLSLNWLALLWIGGTGAAQLIGGADVHRSRFWSGVTRHLSPLYRPRSSVPFTKAGRSH